MNAATIDRLRAEIARQDIPGNRINYQQFFKEKLKEPTGLKASVLRGISEACFRDIRGLSKPEILKICDELLAADERYFRFMAFEWALKIRKQYRKSDFPRFERWLRRHVDNWGACDSLCCGPIGHLVLASPDLAQRVRKWSSSRSRWLRRAAAVSLIVPVRNRLLLDAVFKTADLLLLDGDDMVQKGYGWMLKEASNCFPKEVFAYVIRHKAVMPRTALRYAIEKLPLAMRKKAIAR